MTDALTQRRSLEDALADLRAKYEKHRKRSVPSGELARMIEQLHAEIGIRRRPPDGEADLRRILVNHAYGR